MSFLNKLLNRSRILAIALIILGLCASSAFAVMSVSMTVTPTEGVAPLNVAVSAKANHDAIEPVVYSWDFGDGKTGTGATTTHTFAAPGTYTITVTAVDANSTTVTRTGTVTVNAPKALNVAITANPTSGSVPLAVSFLSVVSGEGPFTYEWDFNGDRVTDSTAQNPSYTYSQIGLYNAKLKVTDSLGNDQTASVEISIVKIEPTIKIVDYSPKIFTPGAESQITFIIENTGNNVISGLDGKLVAPGIVTKTSTKIDNLYAGDRDSITVTFTASQGGVIPVVAKIGSKNFNINLTIQAESYNATELQAKLTALTTEVRSYDIECYDKQTRGFVVGTICDDIKSMLSTLQTAQQNLLDKKYSLVGGALESVTIKKDLVKDQLKIITKPKKTFGEVLKENALLITTLLAATAALGGVLTKMSKHAKDVAQKVHHHIKSTFSGKHEEHKVEAKPKKARKKSAKKKAPEQPKPETPAQ